MKFLLIFINLNKESIDQSKTNRSKIMQKGKYFINLMLFKLNKMMHKGAKNKKSDENITKDSVHEPSSMIEKFIQESGKVKRACRFNNAKRTDANYTEHIEINETKDAIENSVQTKHKANLSTVRLHKFKKSKANDHRLLNTGSPDSTYHERYLANSVKNQTKNESTTKKFQRNLFSKKK